MLILLAGNPSRPAKLRSQSATDGMAARGGVGAVSSTGLTLSAQPTLEKPSRLVPMSPASTIKFKLPSRPHSFIEGSEMQDSSNSSGSGAEPNAARPNSQPAGGWLPRLWSRKRMEAADERDFA